MDFMFCIFCFNGKVGDIFWICFIKSEYVLVMIVIFFVKGLQVEWYEFKGNKCVDIIKVLLNGIYLIEKVMIFEKVKGNIGLVIKGFINVLKDDIYIFVFLLDDGSMLVIDGEQVIDNDGLYGLCEVIGQKVLLKGYYLIEVCYFD